MTQKRKLLVLIGVIISIFLTLIIWSNWNFTRLTKDTFSFKYGTSKKLFYFDTDRDFHGDGFSIEVIKLNALSQKYFQHPPNVFFEDYPKRHYHLNDNYQIYKWKKTPQSKDDTYKTLFAVKPDSTYQSWNFPKKKRDSIIKYLNYADTLLNSKDNYYAMFYKDHPYGLYGVDLFIIAPKDGIIVIVNRQ